MSDTMQPGLEVEDKVPLGTFLSFERVRFANVATAPSIRWGGRNVPLLIHSSGQFQVGGMQFAECSVADSEQRPFFACDSCRQANMSAVDVQGSFVVANGADPNGCIPEWGQAPPTGCKLSVRCNP